ncbi:GNAT family N-acetyltransferase [Flavobacterium agricola]|uniref:GNAT family N-acetyltransferase n=1 Tax=Flavobacterium agricola TaxID=2870839 RepID=A0ABY6M1S3_9FLAO|nr:GNAT family N-acetyltransferase [Flavobacterium agricola]UYW01183.1 GNAT family N-acetyltransferase [Flavobacterium agricola]
MIIRKGEKKDMARVLELIKELAEFEKEPDAVEVTVADLERDGFGTHPLFETFVAEINGTIEGIALYYNRYSTWKGKTIHLEDLIVTQKMRGSGIGQALYARVMQQAKQDNVKRVEWVVLDWNKPAVAFYQKSGATVFNDWRIVQMNEEQLLAYECR